jgi:hypothetical protein
LSPVGSPWFPPAACRARSWSPHPRLRTDWSLQARRPPDLCR